MEPNTLNVDLKMELQNEKAVDSDGVCYSPRARVFLLCM